MPYIIPPHEDELNRRMIALRNIQPMVQEPQQPVSAVAPTQPVQPPAAAATAPIQPDFSKAPISPVAQMPAEQTQSQIRPLDPNSPEFHNSKLRIVLNAIAGGLAGASAGPKAGVEVGEHLRDMKFNRAQGMQDRALSILKPQVASETERRRVGEEETKAGISRGTAQSLAEQRVIKAGQEDKKLDQGQQKIDETKKQDAEKSEHLKYLNEYKSWQMKPENVKKDKFQYIMELPADKQDKAFEVLKKEHEASQDSLETITAKHEAAKTGDIQAENTPAGRQIAESRAEQSTTGRLKAEGSDVGIQTTKNLAEARSNANQLTSNIKDTRAAANAGLQHIPKIIKQIDDMDSAGKLGPIMSKWSDFMAGKVGTDAQAAALRFNIGLMDTLLAKAHGGARGGGSPAMMAHFQSLLSSKNMDAATLKSVLNETKDWLITYSHSGLVDPVTEKPTAKFGADTTRMKVIP